MVAGNGGKDKPVKRRRSVAYARVSSSLRDPDGSLEAQAEAIRKFCEQEGREMAWSYEDNGPAVAKRPGLLQLKSDASSGTLPHRCSRQPRQAGT